MLFAFADFNLTFTALGLPVAAFNGMGTYVAPTDTANPVPDFTDWLDPVLVDFANSSTGLRLHGLSTGLVMQNFTMPMGNQLTYRNMPGRDNPFITSRRTKGQITIEATTVAAKDWITQIKNNTVGAFAMQHGTVAGKIIDLSMHSMQLNGLAYEESDGIMMAQLQYTARPGADTGGNDEIIIVAR
jgi:hypothetical protein